MTPAQYLLAILVSLAPPARMAALPQFPGYEETAVEKSARYASIADDIATVAWDPHEAPIDGSRYGRLNTALLLVSVSFFESGWAKDADLGPCYLGRDGKSSRCDGGRSVSIFQLMVGSGTTSEGWDRAALFGDRQKAARAALHKINRSIKACRSYGAEGRLRMYASGSCEHGEKESAARVNFLRTLRSRFPAPKFDLPTNPTPIAPPPEPPSVSVIESPVYARAEEPSR